MSELITQYENLKTEVEKHSHLYYFKNEPTISDREFDSLFDELLEFEKVHPELATDDSPTKRVGGEPVEGFTTVRKAIPKLSPEGMGAIEAAINLTADKRARDRLEK